MIMEFLDKLGKKATEAYKVTADKTGKLAKETKLKLKIGDLKNQINDLYEEIGKKVYEKHVREQELCIKKDLEEECTKIDVLSDEIEVLLKQCLELKDKKQCDSCHTQIEKEDKFCPKCGAKQTEEPAKEAEVLEVLKSTNVEPNRVEEKEDIIEDLEAKISDKNEEDKDDFEENLKKTIAIEADIDINEENKME